jgi:hypothetical protein
MQRTYTVAEIDQMRRDVRELNGGHGGNDMVAEEMLRTYMLNGTEPADLKEAADKRRAGRPLMNEYFSPETQRQDAASVRNGPLKPWNGTSRY